MEEKRLFFGMEVHAPWPASLPSGRLLEEEDRHLTFAFLGKVDYEAFSKHIPEIPLPSFKVGFVGTFDQCLFLPPHHPHVVAWDIAWLEKIDPLLLYHQTLHSWLESKGFPADQRHDFHPHVTLARSPFHYKEWRKRFVPLPFFATQFHLYESVGNLQYQSLWKASLLPPLEELDHTADIGFLIRGESFLHLFQHAQIALAFPFPEILPFFKGVNHLDSLEDVIILLNEVVSNADREIGTPYKAVSFHGDCKQEGTLYQWEMIIDV